MFIIISVTCELQTGHRKKKPATERQANHWHDIRDMNAKRSVSIGEVSVSGGLQAGGKSVQLQLYLCSTGSRKFPFRRNMHAEWI